MTDQPAGWDAAVATADPPVAETPAEVPAPAPDVVDTPPDVAPEAAPEVAPAPPEPAPEPEPAPAEPEDLRQSWLCVTPEGVRTMFRGADEAAPSVCPEFKSDLHIAGEHVRCPHCGSMSVVKLQDWIAGRARLGLPA